MRQAIFFNTPIIADHIGEQMSELYKEKVYEPFLAGKKDLVILDIGAMGFTSYYFAEFAKVVYAFEPNRESFETLTEMLEFNKSKGWTGNVVPMKAAISNTDGEAILHHTGNKTMTSFNPADGFATGEQEVVKTVRLDSFMKENNLTHIDFIKLDVEGIEDEIFCGEGFLNVADKIDVIVFELHNWIKRNKNQVLDALKQAGFTLDQIQGDATIYVARRK